MPVYNQITFTLACIDALVAHRTRLRFEILVGDDCSSDPTRAALGIPIRGARHVRHARNLEQYVVVARRGGERDVLLFALGESLRDELRDTGRAVEAFNAALDLDPLFIEAFSAIEAMLGAAKEWKQLEENYARMIQRLPKTDETESARMALWRTLGDLYLQVLKQPESALMAYKVAAAGLPDDATVQETYAELLLASSGQRGARGPGAAARAGPHPEPEEGGEPAGRARRPQEGLRRSLARRAGGDGAPGRSGTGGEGDPHQARPLREEARDAAGHPQRPGLGPVPPAPQGARRRSPS